MTKQEGTEKKEDEKSFQHHKEKINKISAE
jgi:hypothetical protein